MELINKAAVVAELEKRLKNLQKEYNELVQYQIWAGAKDIEPRINEIQKTISSIDTLGVKEVNLEKEIDDWYNTVGIPVTADALKETARHFVELGLKVQKGE